MAVPAGTSFVTASVAPPAAFASGRYAQTATIAGTSLKSEAATDVCPSPAAVCTRIDQEEIGDNWQRFAGGEAGAVGRPTTGTSNTACGGGRWNGFERGVVSFRADVGAHWTRGAAQSKWASLGHECGLLGFMTSDIVAGLKAGGTVQSFQGGVVYSSPVGTFVVRGAMLAKYAELGYEGGFLGYPKSDDFSGAKPGGSVQNFEGGVLYSTSWGTYFVRGEVLSEYARVGYESGYGYPRSDEQPSSCRAGTRSGFEGGLIVKGPATGAHSVYGTVLSKWASMGYECSFLGFPKSHEVDGHGPPPGGFVRDPPNGRQQVFEGSSIFWNRFSGETHAFGEGGGASAYFGDSDRSQLLLKRTDASVDVDWGSGSPGPSVPSDNFGGSWYTRLWVPTDGDYQFYTLSILYPVR